MTESSAPNHQPLLAPSPSFPAASEALNLEMPGFRLLKLSNLMSQPFFGQFAKQHSLTLNEWRTILVLANRPGSAAQDISAATGLHPMNISRAVIAMRKRGFIQEARDPDNHRRVLLWLTHDGNALFRSIAPHSAAKNQQLFGILSDDELQYFSRILDKLMLRAEQITQHTTDPSSDCSQGASA